MWNAFCDDKPPTLRLRKETIRIHDQAQVQWRSRHGRAQPAIFQCNVQAQVQCRSLLALALARPSPWAWLRPRLAPDLARAPAPVRAPASSTPTWAANRTGTGTTIHQHSHTHNQRSQCLFLSRYVSSLRRLTPFFSSGSRFKCRDRLAANPGLRTVCTATPISPLPEQSVQLLS